MNVLLAKQPLRPTLSAAHAELREWVKGGLRLERPSASVSHRLRHAMLHERIEELSVDEEHPDTWMPGDMKGHSFVIQNDWAGAFRDAQDFDTGEYRLPFEGVYFELRVSGKPVVIYGGDVSAENMTYNVMFFPFVETSHGWIVPHGMCTLDRDGFTPLMPENRYTPLLRLALEQIRAVSICMEAGIATTETVPAPTKLNKARERRGKTPLADYHIVRLHSRYRGEGEKSEPGGRKRLHFRRGHWRHLDERRTWVRWTLVGNPDLGFVEKEYRL